MEQPALDAKVDRNQRATIEDLIAIETGELRRKLYEAFAQPFSGEQKVFKVKFTVDVEEN